MILLLLEKEESGEISRKVLTEFSFVFCLIKVLWTQLGIDQIPKNEIVMKVF